MISNDKNWNTKRLKYLISRLESGNRESGEGRYLSEGIFSIGGEHISFDGKILKTNKKYISVEFYKNLNTGKIRVNDILLVKDGATIGKKAFIDNLPDEKCAVNEHVFILRPLKYIYPKFLSFIIESEKFQNEMNLYVRGAAQPGLNQEFTSKIYIHFPNLENQKLIADFLDYKTAQIDELIEQKEKLLELLEEKRIALITKAVTKGLNPDVKMKPSGIDWLGDIPEHWEIKRLKYITDCNKLSLPEDTNEEYSFYYVDISSVDLIKGIINKEYMSFGEAPSRARRIVRKGDTIVSTVRTYLKAIASIKEDENIIVSTGFAVISPKKIINSNYLSFFLQNEIFINMIVANSVGVSYPAINPSELINLSVLLPPIYEQTSIANYLKNEIYKIDSLCQEIVSAIEKLKEYRSALITAAVTGKIDVRNFKPENKNEIKRI